MTPAKERAWQAARDADAAFSAELQRVYGKAASEARYDARGEATPELQRLAREKVAAYGRYHDAVHGDGLRPDQVARIARDRAEMARRAPEARRQYWAAKL